MFARIHWLHRTMNTSNQNFKLFIVLFSILSLITSISRIEKNGFTTLPHYQGGQQSKSFTGYLQVRPQVNGHLFFWLTESTSLEPEKDPLVLWLNGGNCFEFSKDLRLFRSWVLKYDWFIWCKENYYEIVVTVNLGERTLQNRCSRSCRKTRIFMEFLGKRIVPGSTSECRIVVYGWNGRS